MRQKFWILGLCVAAGVSIAVALAVVSTGQAAKNALPARDIYMSAAEWKGSSNISKEPYPGPVPPGGGYESFAPGHEEVADEPGKWATETYRFDTAVVMAYAGERVKLRIFGVNAKEHQIIISDFNKQFTVKRGVVSNVSFVVKKPGIYKIICLTHPPSHQRCWVIFSPAKRVGRSGTGPLPDDTWHSFSRIPIVVR